MNKNNVFLPTDSQLLTLIEHRVDTLRALNALEEQRPTIDAPVVKDELASAQRELATFLALKLPTVRFR